MKSLPIRVYTLYISLTMIISFFGPAKYPNYEKLSVFLYIFAFLLSLFVGYAIANRHKFVLKRKPRVSNDFSSILHASNNVKVMKFVSASITIAFLSIAMEFLELIIRNPGAFSLSKMADNYFEKNLGLRESFYSLPLLFRFLSGFFRNAAVVLGVYFWGKLQRKHRRALLFFFVLLTLVNMLAYGTQKFIGDLVIYVIIALAIKALDSDARRIKNVTRISLLLVLLLVIVFTIMQAQRYAFLGITAENFGVRSGGQVFYDTNHFIFTILGKELGLGLATFVSGYLSAGYYGLSLCLKLPFEWTYGIGNSYFLTKFFSVAFNTADIYEKTYLNRMTLVFGRDGLQSWNTIFPWLASDFTFVGALLIFVFVGYFWQRAWLEIIRYRNHVSIVFFAALSLGLIFVPANNQLLNSIDTFIATFITIVYWLSYHNKYNY